MNAPCPKCGGTDVLANSGGSQFPAIDVYWAKCWSCGFEETEEIEAPTWQELQSLHPTGWLGVLFGNAKDGSPVVDTTQTPKVQR